MYKGAIFDLDDTLYNYEYADENAIGKLCEFAITSLGVSREVFLEAYTHAKRLVKNTLNDCAAQHNRMLYCQRTLELLGLSSIKYALEMYDVYWDTFLDHMIVYDSVIPLFEDLKVNQILIAICTDLTAHIQHRKLHRLGIDSYVDFIVTSEETGVEKPHPHMFLACLEKMSLKQNQVLYIGDSFKKDILGAIQIGIKPIWLDREGIKRENREMNYCHVTNFAEIQKYFKDGT